MNQQLKILILEDNKSDIYLLEHELKKAPLNYISKVVQNEASFEEALCFFKPDIILSDYSLPAFNGTKAFALTKILLPGTPFIIVSGTIGDENAVELIKSGVTDYILKGKLFGLPQKIDRALKDLQKAREKSATDQKLAKLKNLYAFISEVNQNIVRVKNEEILFRNSCKLAIEFGEFKMSWIGMFDFGEGKISLVEQCGIVYEDLSLFMNAPYRISGPQDFVLQNERYFICNDILNDKDLAYWHPFCEKRGINSCMVLPIKKSGKIIGTFNLYSSEFGFSEPEEISLLAELTDDISFALDLFEKEKKHNATKELVIKNERRFRALIEQGSDVVSIFTESAEMIYTSSPIEKILGYQAEDFIKLDFFSLIHPEDLPATKSHWEKTMYSPGIPIKGHTKRLLHKNGDWRWVEATTTNMLHDPAIGGIVKNFRDVTQKFEAEIKSEFEKNNFDALINNTKDLMWSVDINFNLITSNIPFEDMSKFNSGKTILKGENVLVASTTGETNVHFKNIYERAFTGEAFTEIIYSEKPSESWSEISYYPIRRGAEVVGTACHSRDITDTKLWERKIQKSEAFNSGILNSLSAHLAVVDASGAIIAVNEAWKRFALNNDTTAISGIGANYFEVCENAIKNGDPEVAEILKAIKEVIDGGRNTYYIEYPCHSPNEQRWFGMRVMKFESEEPMVVIAHQNITQRRKVEENLIQSELRLKEAQAIAHLGNWEVNFETKEAIWSDEACKIYGLSPDDSRNNYLEWLSFVHPDDKHLVLEEYRRGLQTLTDANLNHRIVLKNGQIKHIQAKGRFKLDQHGVPKGFYGIILDVTVRKLADAEREKMIFNIIQHSKNLEQFASIVSHNLRAPVANILGLAELLKGNISQVDRLRSQEYLFTATRNLDDIVTDLNKILAVRSDINEYKETIYFGELVNAIRSSIYILFEKEKVEIVTDFSEVNKITSIKSFLYSIFFNLISNSIKYRQDVDAPKILIKSSLVKDKVRFSFKDNGIGIDLARFGDQVFGPYKRFHLKKEGKGLGLFMSKTQIETLGGTISIESTPGIGSEFFIEIPNN